MIISINWLKKFTSIDLPIYELTDLIGARLVEIEEVTQLGDKYKDVLAAKVVECYPLENSDHLNVTKLDDGGVTAEIERDENGNIQVVCGAPNVRAGLLVAWLPPGSTVPESFQSENQFVLSVREICGFKSHGMIASGKELDLFDDHTGILEVDKDAAPGSKFSEVYELDDYLLEIENKSLTHRPDVFGIIGFAREVAAIQGKAFESPAWLKQLDTPVFGSHQLAAPTVIIDDPSLCDRYQAVVLTGTNANAQSPLQIQSYLSRVGVRPINAVVDVTNYLMMLTGQPLHAFDYDKLKEVGGGQATIHVRSAKANEKLKLLDGHEIELDPSDIVIASENTVVGLAGAMGGATTEIDATTKNIILESATFNLYNLRATQMRHGIFSEAITRFTKGQPAELTAPVISQAIQLLNDYAGAEPATPVAESYPAHDKRHPVVSVKLKSANQVLGSKYSASDVIETLQNVEFEAELEDPLTIKTIPPYWRADINIPEDIIEEVGRLNGFDSIEATLPLRDFTAIQPNEFDKIKSRLRNSLVRGGASEVLTYSFVHGNLLQKAAQNPNNSYRLINSLSPDLQYYRQTISPSLLNLVHPNIKKGFDNFGLFEINKAHSKTSGLNEENIPSELSYLAFIVASKHPKAGAAYFDAKAHLDNLAYLLGLKFSYNAIDQEDQEDDNPLAAPFEYRRSATVNDTESREFLGIIGEYKQSVIRGFKLPEYTAGFEVNTIALLKALKTGGVQYEPISRYPSLERDICFQVSSDISYSQVEEPLQTALQSSGLRTEFWPIDIYVPEGNMSRNITFRIKLTAHGRTLTGDDAARVISDAAGVVISKTEAKVI